LQTDKSKAILNPDEKIISFFSKEIWHSCEGVDVGAMYTTSVLKRQELMTRSDQRMQKQLANYLNSK